MTKIGFLFSIYEAKTGTRLITQSVQGNKMGPVLREIAKTVRKYETQLGEGQVVLKTIKARLSENKVIMAPKKLDSVNTMLTMVTEHYGQKDNSLMVESSTPHGTIAENLLTILKDKKKIAKLMEKVTPAEIPIKDKLRATKDKLTDKAYHRTNDAYSPLRKLKMRIHDIQFDIYDEEEHLALAHRMHHKTYEGRSVKDIEKSIVIKKAQIAKWKSKVDGMTAEWQKRLVPIKPNLPESKLHELDLPKLDVGDTLLVGKWKNRSAVIKGFETDDNGQPVAKTNKGDQQIFKGRVKKLMPEKG